MQILAIISGEYGARHVSNIRDHGPSSWSLETWQAPSIFPLVIDYRRLSSAIFTCADLILSFGEHKGIAELLPDMLK